MKSRGVNMNRSYDKAKVGKILLFVFVLSAAVYLFLLYFANQRVDTVDVSGCDRNKIGRASCRERVSSAV